MLDLPPLFTPSAPPETGPDRAAWWALANDLAAAVTEAESLMALEDLKHRRRQDLSHLRSHASDLAGTLSIVFAERRRALGWWWPEPPVYGDGEK